MKNVYFDKLQKHLQSFVDDFIRLRSATLAQLQLDMDTLKNPRPSMERTFGQAIERAYALKEQMLTKGKQILDSEKDRLSATTETTVLEELKKLDEVAYIRFASVYRRFQDLNEFRKEIDLMASSAADSDNTADE